MSDQSLADLPLFSKVKSGAMQVDVSGERTIRRAPGDIQFARGNSGRP